MGRYTSVQTYSDESTKGGDRRTTESLGLEVGNGTYAAAEGSEEASQGASGSRKRERVEVEKIKPVSDIIFPLFSKNSYFLECTSHGMFMFYS